MKEKTNSNQSPYDSNANSVPNKQPKQDETLVRSQQEQYIPSLLRQVVPAEMRITPVGPGPDGRSVYMVTKDLIYGTAEDIVEYLMDNLLLSDHEIELDIFKVGEGIDGPLYVLSQFILGGTAGGIIEHFGC